MELPGFITFCWVICCSVHLGIHCWFTLLFVTLPCFWYVVHLVVIHSLTLFLFHFVFQLLLLIVDCSVVVIVDTTCCYYCCVGVIVIIALLFIVVICDYHSFLVLRHSALEHFGIWSAIFVVECDVHYSIGELGCTFMGAFCCPCLHSTPRVGWYILFHAGDCSTVMHLPCWITWPFLGWRCWWRCGTDWNCLPVPVLLPSTIHLPACDGWCLRAIVVIFPIPLLFVDICAIFGDWFYYCSLFDVVVVVVTLLLMMDWWWCPVGLLLIVCCSLLLLRILVVLFDPLRSSGLPLLFSRLFVVAILPVVAVDRYHIYVPVDHSLFTCSGWFGHCCSCFVVVLLLLSLLLFVIVVVWFVEVVPVCWLLFWLPYRCRCAVRCLFIAPCPVV